MLFRNDPSPPWPQRFQTNTKNENLYLKRGERGDPIQVGQAAADQPEDLQVGKSCSEVPEETLTTMSKHTLPFSSPQFASPFPVSNGLRHFIQSLNTPEREMISRALRTPGSLFFPMALYSSHRVVYVGVCQMNTQVRSHSSVL